MAPAPDGEHSPTQPTKENRTMTDTTTDPTPPSVEHDNTEPRVWWGCLGCYNAGHLHGEWCTLDELAEAVSSCPWCGGDEFDTMDRENLPAELEEWATRFPADAAEWWAEHGDDIPRILAYVEEFGEVIRTTADAENVAERSTDALLHEFSNPWETLADYAEQWHDECGMLDALPEWVRYHINWESIARDMTLSGEVAVHWPFVFSTVR